MTRATEVIVVALGTGLVIGVMVHSGRRVSDAGRRFDVGISASPGLGGKDG